MEKKQREYGLVTAVCMVVGSVIGSGIFFKAEQINRVLKGNIALGVMAWGIGGTVMLVCIRLFACFAQTYKEENTLIGYAEKTVGKSYAYYTGVFMATVYYPAMCSVLSYLCCRYTLISLGITDYQNATYMLFSVLILFIGFLISSVSAYLAGKVQVITTVIKLIPLFIMIIFGITHSAPTAPLFSGTDREAETVSLYGAVASSAFAYDGWIAVVAIGGKIKNRRKNLPRALICGGIIVAVVYILYYVGLSSVLESVAQSENAKESVKMAFDCIIKGSGSVLTVFVAISCFGALNALMLGCTGAMYFLAQKGRCPFRECFLKTTKKHRVPIISCITGFLLSLLWLLFYFCTQISENRFFALLAFDSSELPVVTAYAMYIPMFFMYMRECRKKHLMGKFVLSAGGICACLFMVYSAAMAHKEEMFSYICFISSLMLVFSLCGKK